MRDLLRKLAWLAVPGYMANRAVRWNLGVERRAGPPVEIGEVESGPFAGLAYPETVTGDVISPGLKRAGTYEATLATLVAKEFARQPPLFVDVGAADGYYAVSGARAGITTIAYESSSLQRRTLRRVADANQARVEIQRHCRRLPPLPSGTLILMDVEGAEARLLGRDAPRRLAGCTVIVELHEHFVPGLTDRLLHGFKETHGSQLIEGEREPGRQGGKPVWAVFRPGRP